MYAYTNLCYLTLNISLKEEYLLQSSMKQIQLCSKQKMNPG